MISRKKKIAYYLLVIALLISTGLLILFHTLSDLRTEVSINSPNTEKATQLIKEMGIAHGIENWKDIDTYQVSFQEEFYGFIGDSGNPFAQDKTTFKMNYVPGQATGQLAITSGINKGNVWGISSWDTYTLKDEEVTYLEDDNIKFWLPTYQYFIEFPYRIQEATSFTYAGEKTIDNVLCEGVIASWNTTEPQDDIDQYLIWIDKESKRIVKMEYTIRELYSFLTGAAYFKDFKTFNGILMPTRFPVESNLVNDGLLHEMQLLDFKANVVPREELEL